MTEAAQKRPGPGTVPQVCAKNSNDPSGGLIASPIPVVADEIAADAEDLAPRKELHFASVDWHGRGIDRFGREAWRGPAFELAPREPGIVVIASPVPFSVTLGTFVRPAQSRVFV